MAGIELRPGNRKVVALVGPTGVGKTTTIAKIAANFRLRDKKTVGLITADTYRIAAVEQLRTYAEIIDLPLEVVTTPREMRRAVLQMEHLDLVLIDTAGRSPHDELRLHELRALLREANPDETHLVLSTDVAIRGSWPAPPINLLCWEPMPLSSQNWTKPTASEGSGPFCRSVLIR